MANDPVAPQGKRALLVGINTYPNFPPERQLRGCLNDVALLRATLQTRFGFPEDGITVLTDDQATRDGILAAMKQLADETGRDDVVLVFYSGHGSQMSDREHDEPDFYDETIIPFDSGRSPHKNRDITDDEIYLWLKDLGQKTGNVTLWFDCCNSGSLTRAAFGGATRSVPRDDRPPSELPESPIPRSEWAALAKARGDAGPSGWAPVGDRYVMIAACRDEQTANEYPPAPGPADEVHGCLTYYLHQELMNAGPGTTYRDVFDAARRRVTAAYPDQTPQLEGNRDRVLFGLADLAPAHFLEVTARADGAVTLDGGLTHAVRAGSRWAVYPPGTKQADGAVARVGVVQVTTIRGLTSDARVVEEATQGVITAGCRGFELDSGFGDASLAVSLAPAPAGLDELRRQLADRLAQSKTIRVAGPGEAATTQAILLEPRAAAGPGAAVPQLGEVKAPTWAIVGGGDRLLAPPKPAAVVGAVVENLETIARFFYLLAIRNPASSLQGKVAVTLLRKPKGGDWQEARPDAADRIVYRVGDQLAFRVRHQHTDPLYLNVLDFGFTYKVSLVYPPARGAAEVIEPLLPFEFGKRDGQRMFLQPFPDDFDGTEGRETLKLILATRPIDFSWMRQEGVREKPPLTRAIPPEEWTTVEVEFVVVRQ
jgi:hypothetical protein